MYIKALSNGLFGINPGLELTYIDNLPRFIVVSCNMNMSFEFIDATVHNINYNEPPVLHAGSSTAHLISCEYMPFFKFSLFHLLYKLLIVFMYVCMFMLQFESNITVAIWSVQEGKL